MDKINVFNGDSLSLNGRKVASLMGRKVVVSIAMVRRYDAAAREDRWIESLCKEPRTGWVIGARRVYDGKAVIADFDGPREFQSSGSTPVLLVSYWPTERPVHVFPDEASIRFWCKGEEEPFSSNWGISKSQRDHNLQHLRENMWAYPRDEKGRFRSCTNDELARLCREHGA